METFHEYQVDLYWKEDQNARISSMFFKESIEVASQSCLNDLTDDMWSAEHLFIAAVESSYMTSFFKTAKNKGIKYSSFKCNAKASVVVTDDQTEITDIMIRPTATISDKKQINKTLNIFLICKEYSLVLSALKIRVHIFPTVIVQR